jgi:hypothetical protein
MYIVNPDIYLKPDYKLSPFDTSYIDKYNKLKSSKIAIKYFNDYFRKSDWEYTINGREAIFLALKNYDLSKNDIITIITTSNNFYISSCVTNTIEKICKWSRKIEKKTKLIFLIHEFGYPINDYKKLTDLNIPIIEDCCTTFFSQNKNTNIGLIGDFSIYSFPKFFPIQIGGLLVSNKFPNSFKSIISKNESNFINSVLSLELKRKRSILNKRTINHTYLLKLFKKIGFKERFKITINVIPYALLLKNNGIIKNLDKFKVYLNHNGIQSSVFYGEDAFFIPCHQNLTISDLNYFYQCFLFYLKNLNSKN